MSWKEWFKKDAPKPKKSVNRVEEIANKLQRENRSGEIEASLRGFNSNELTEKEQESLHHLLGIEAMRRQDWEAALTRFLEAARLFPESQMIRFSLAQEYERRGAFNQAFELFDRCSYPRLPATWALAQARYAYLWGFPDRGAAYVRPIFDAYFKLGIADDNFLYMRGLPFFGQAWNYMVAFAWMAQDFSEAQKLIDESASKLQDYDFNGPQTFLACLRNSDFQPWIERLRSVIDGAAGRNWPTGFQRMRLTAIEVATGQDFSSVEKLISSLQLAPGDFPWLDDIRVVLLAKLNYKHRRLEEEIQFKQRFLSQQKMLFEPEHAVSFLILDYQERLKPDYQTSRRL